MMERESEKERRKGGEGEEEEEEERRTEWEGAKTGERKGRTANELERTRDGKRVGGGDGEMEVH